LTGDSRIVPGSTYRLQFSGDFGFADAARIAGYLRELGVTHVYASPYLKARPGSSHGYDVVDYNALNPELGDDSDFDVMCRAFSEHQLQQILDFVPNHMGVGGSDNPFWLSVLEWGQSSPYAEWFDIDWNSGPVYLRGKLLVPFLGEQYGSALQSGHLRLKFDASEGSFAVWAYDVHKLPICPVEYASILGNEHPGLERFADEFNSLSGLQGRIPRSLDLKSALALEAKHDSSLLTALEKAAGTFFGRDGELATWEALDQLIQRQHWRPAHFRVAADDINYRRFFNINDLAGTRVEVPSLFDEMHKLVFRLFTEGKLSGLRIDHIDGLFDPAEYLRRVRTALPGEVFLVVEKILATHETLPSEWPVDGTTGYDFLAQVTGLLIRGDAKDELLSLYSDFTGNRESFEETVRIAKLRITDNEMAGELQMRAREMAGVARQNPLTSDFTENILRRALRQIVACFPVYRTYVSVNGPSESDRRYIDWAITRALRHEPDIDSTVFEFIRSLLTADLVAEPRSQFSRYSVLKAAREFQQFTGPVMAKGLEDTAFYRYNPFLALNEVGSSPMQFGISVSAFHKANAARAKSSPATLLATATHDTKRGEDARARLAVLSEVPAEWSQQVNAWSRILRVRRGDLELSAPPTRNDEYMFYQMLLASWPAELCTQDTLNQQILAPYAERLQSAVQKAIREARIRSNWISPNAEYEGAVDEFITDALDAKRSASFLSLFQPFAARVAQCGIHNSLSQLVLKLTSPGVPDIYQGCELWNLSFMDPDNRTPVDFAARETQLARIRQRLGENPRAALRDWLANWHDGSIKMAILHILLRFRQQFRKLFTEGGYAPIQLEGSASHHICAFTRTYEEMSVVIAVKLFAATDVGGDGWMNTRLVLPDTFTTARDILTQAALVTQNGSTIADAVFADLPVAVLVSSDLGPHKL
jgi:(1->4)-alpha-D-glucan 1-alpha-D-glucosylmutase